MPIGIGLMPRLLGAGA